MTDSLPDRLQQALAGRYRLERELGRGGMATVYLAYDLKHDRRVALKVLHSELAATLGPERFLREIRTTARLDHPHILPVHDSGETHGQLWYTMPYVEGESLRDRLRREVQLPVEEAVRLAREVADALDYAHRHGLVHRDVKPENILLSDGHARVADFGVAKALDQASGKHLTETGVAVGTPQYMAPEQAGGGAVDTRADVYALGCVLYEMLAGEPPYTGSSPQAVFAKRILEPLPQVRTLRESVPEGVGHALSRALAKVPADRFQTAAEFASALVVPAVSTVAGAVQAAPGTTDAVATATALPRPNRSRRVRVGVVALTTGLLLGLGVLFAWLRTGPGTQPAGPRRLAVLPFENLGDSADAYFADGVTDAIRGKLTSLPGLEVIASNSSGQYRRTSKPPQQIARELGVDYLLVGKVRWEKGINSTSRVQVSPELIQGASAAARWQQPFDAALTDVFEVQGQIAARVAEALHVALGEGERERLAEQPTENLAAYDAFLRGEAGGLNSADPNALERARDYYERAVALDSTFALAWAQLSHVYSALHWVTPTAAGAVAARRAADRALALAPNRPYGYVALAHYYNAVRYETGPALQASLRGFQLAPGDAVLLTAVGWGEFDLGRPEEALAHMRQAQVLDPRSIEVARGVVWPLLGLRRHDEALAAAERALALAPSNPLLIHLKVLVYLASGDLAGAQAVLEAARRELNSAMLVAYMAQYDLYWVLDEAQQRLLLSLSPDSFGGDRASWSLALAETHALRGNAALARAYADSARLGYEARLGDVPQDAPTHTYLGLALAYSGRPAEAIREGERGVALMPISRNPSLRADLQHLLAWIYIVVGEPEKALDRLEPLLRLPYYYSAGWMRINPSFAPLRGNPRFERLVKGS